MGNEKTKIIRISLTVKLFKWVKYIAREKDGSLWGFRCEPYVNTRTCSDYSQWIPSSLISLCQYLVSGCTLSCGDWRDTLSYVGDGDRKQRFVFDIGVPSNSKYIFMNQRGDVFASKIKPYIRKKNDLWVCGYVKCVLHTKQICEEWRDSLREIKEENTWD